MSEVEDAAKESIESSNYPLNRWIALTVAISATLMAIGNIKDGNIVQAMTQAQARSVDAWSYYQAKSTKQVIAANSADQLRTQILMAPNMPATLRTSLEAKVARFEAEARRYDKEKEEIRQSAENYEKEYDRLNMHDDQFDMSEAFFTAAIALCGVTALVRRRWLFIIGVTFACIGLLLEVAGFMKLAFHPEWLAKLLG